MQHGPMARPDVVRHRFLPLLLCLFWDTDVFEVQGRDMFVNRHIGLSEVSALQDRARFRCITVAVSFCERASAQLRSARARRRPQSKAPIQLWIGSPQSQMDWCAPGQVSIFHAGGRSSTDHSWLFCAPTATPGGARARVRIRRSDFLPELWEGAPLPSPATRGERE